MNTCIVDRSFFIHNVVNVGYDEMKVIKPASENLTFPRLDRMKNICLQFISNYQT